MDCRKCLSNKSQPDTSVRDRSLAAARGYADAQQQFDSDNNEQAVILFDQPVNITAINFGFFSGSDVFQVGETLLSADLVTDSNDNIVLADPIFAEANAPLLLTATVGNVSIEQFELNVLEAAAIPEPSSILSLMGLAGLLAVKRRR